MRSNFLNFDVSFNKTALNLYRFNTSTFARTAGHFCVVLAMTVVAWTVLANTVFATTMTYPITEDTRIDSDNSGRTDRTLENYGGDSLKMIINSADHYGGSYVRTLIDLPDESASTIASATANDTLSSVKLWIDFWWINVAVGEEFEDRGIVAHPLTQSFTEFGATFMSYDGTNAWSTPGGDYDSSISIEWEPETEGQVSGWYYFDLTSLYTSGYDLSNGLIMMFDPETPPASSNSWATYCADSSESGGGPYLEITTVPEPSSFMLLATSLLGGTMMILRRSRQR